MNLARCQPPTAARGESQFGAAGARTKGRLLSTLVTPVLSGGRPFPVGERVGARIRSLSASTGPALSRGMLASTGNPTGRGRAPDLKQQALTAIRVWKPAFRSMAEETDASNHEGTVVALRRLCNQLSNALGLLPTVARQVAGGAG